MGRTDRGDLEQGPKNALINSFFFDGGVNKPCQGFPRAQVTSLHTEPLGMSPYPASLGAAGAVPVAGGGRGGTRRWEKS